MKVKEFFINMAKGAAIGLAMIIPGVSGGTLAVLLKIYDKMIDAISSLRKRFKESFLYLLPIVIGIVAAFAAAYFPLTLALEYAPFPTMLCFAGLMAGSCPKLFSDNKKQGFKKIDLLALVPFALVIGLCFIPGMKDADLTVNMAWYQYILVAVMGVLASCALVVPGISGSMLLMIFGYYTPVLRLFLDIFKTPGHSVAVLACFGVGVVVGFFTIAKLMQLLLHKFPRATGWAIFGFVVGSIPAVIITFFNKYAESLSRFLTPLHISLGVVLFCAGAVATFFFTRYADKPGENQSAPAQNLPENETAGGELSEETQNDQTDDGHISD